jgi:hypothetical protein
MINKNIIAGNHLIRSCSLLVVVLLAWNISTMAQQRPDIAYMPPIRARYHDSNNSVVMVDEAHHNFHTASGGYRPFANVLKSHGYIVKPGVQPFSKASLKGVKILVIVNALNEANATSWALPTPSAFSFEEIEAVNEWVRRGGALFLIADHMPFPGAASELARSFGFRFYNGFAFDSTDREKFCDIFKRSDGTLGPVSKLAPENIDSIASFTGQAFDIPQLATSLLNTGGRHIILLPTEAWVFDKTTPRLEAKGKSQGAIMEYGKGRVAVFGEAAMFTAQIAGDMKVGMNSQQGADNSLLLLALVRWLKHED